MEVVLINHVISRRDAAVFPGISKVVRYGFESGPIWPLKWSDMVTGPGVQFQTSESSAFFPLTKRERRVQVPMDAEVLEH